MSFVKLLRPLCFPNFSITIALYGGCGSVLQESRTARGTIVRLQRSVRTMGGSHDFEGTV